MNRTSRRALQSFGALFSTKTRSDRLEVLKKVLDDQILEFTEDNMPTNVVMFFEDVIRALPYSANEKFDLPALFNEALETVKK